MPFRSARLRTWRGPVALCALQLVFSLQASGQIIPGAPECPCVTRDWPLFPELEQGLVQAGFDRSYGLDGCKTYDAIFNATGCGVRGEQPLHCDAAWCYINPDTCPVNATVCWDAGLWINDPSNPACRTRPNYSSRVVPSSARAFYSYSTCNSVNDYDISRHQTAMRGTGIITTTTDDVPYTSRLETPAGDDVVVSYGGVHVDFMRGALARFQPEMPMRIVDGWATAESRAKFSSSYTAAVHDVAVGNFDVVVGDFWVTSERMLLTNFLPSVRTDNFYLVVFEEDGATSFRDMLANPFAPFTVAAWGLIVGAVVVSAAAMAVIDFSDDEQFPYAARAVVWRGGKALYLGLASLMEGSVHFSASSLPSKVVVLGFQLFLVIVIASYTANLASLLVVSSVQTGVDSIEDAIELGLTICVPAAIEATVRLNYPSLRMLAYAGSTADFARLMHAGRCDGAVIHLKRIAQLHAGAIQQSDCDRVTAGELTEAEGRCREGYGGGDRDDCKLIRVGVEPIFTIPVAFPVRHDNPDLLTALSWAMTDAQNAGGWESAVSRNSNLFPQTRCAASAVSSTELDWDSFAGAAFFSAVAAALGLIIHALTNHRPSNPCKGKPASRLPSIDSGAGATAELTMGPPDGNGKGNGTGDKGNDTDKAMENGGGGSGTERQLDQILLKLEALEKKVGDGGGRSGGGNRVDSVLDSFNNMPREKTPQLKM